MKRYLHHFTEFFTLSKEFTNYSIPRIIFKENGIKMAIKYSIDNMKWEKDTRDAVTKYAEMNRVLYDGKDKCENCKHCKSNIENKK